LPSSHVALSPFPTRRSSDLAPPSVSVGLLISYRSQAPSTSIRLDLARLISYRSQARSTSIRLDLARLISYRSQARSTSITHKRSDRKSTRLNSSHVSISYAV